MELIRIHSLVGWTDDKEWGTSLVCDPPPPKPKWNRGEKFQLLFGQPGESSPTSGIPQMEKDD